MAFQLWDGKVIEFLELSELFLWGLGALGDSNAESSTDDRVWLVKFQKEVFKDFIGAIQHFELKTYGSGLLGLKNQLINKTSEPLK